MGVASRVIGVAGNWGDGSDVVNVTAVGGKCEITNVTGGLVMIVLPEPSFVVTSSW